MTRNNSPNCNQSSNHTFPDSDFAARQQPEVHGAFDGQQEAADGDVRPVGATTEVEVRELHPQPGQPGSLTDLDET